MPFEQVGSYMNSIDSILGAWSEDNELKSQYECINTRMHAYPADKLQIEQNTPNISFSVLDYIGFSMSIFSYYRKNCRQLNNYGVNQLFRELSVCPSKTGVARYIFQITQYKINPSWSFQTA